VKLGPWEPDPHPDIILSRRHPNGHTAARIWIGFHWDTAPAEGCKGCVEWTVTHGAFPIEMIHAPTCRGERSLKAAKKAADKALRRGGRAFI